VFPGIPKGRQIARLLPAEMGASTDVGPLRMQ